MGWTVLYIAFGFVALWLLGEVLLQYKARLRWRLVAFFGFLGVVIGVLLPSLPVIALGAVAFATGQTFVTLSFRRGFSTGWALGGKPGTSRRRREQGADEHADDAPDEAGEAPPPPPPPGAAAGQAPDEGFATEQFTRQDFGADTPEGERFGHGAAGQEEFAEPAYAAGGYGYPDGYQDPAVEAAYQEPYPGAHQQSYGGATGYTEQGQYLAGGTDGYGYQTGWESQGDAHSGQRDAGQPAQAGFGGESGGYPGSDGWSDGAGTPYYQETPAGGVWVPQQREGTADEDPYGYQQQQQQPADPYGQQPGYDPSGSGYYYNDGRYPSG